MNERIPRFQLLTPSLIAIINNQSLVYNYNGPTFTAHIPPQQRFQWQGNIASVNSLITYLFYNKNNNTVW